MVLKSKIFNECNAEVQTFVRIDSQILMSNAFSWYEIIVYEVLLSFSKSLLILSQLSIPTGPLFTVA